MYEKQNINFDKNEGTHRYNWWESLLDGFDRQKREKEFEQCTDHGRPQHFAVSLSSINTICFHLANSDLENWKESETSSHDRKDLSRKVKRKADISKNTLCGKNYSFSNIQRVLTPDPRKYFVPGIGN